MPGGVELSRLDKVLWPDKAITKGDLIAYFRAVAPALLPHLRDRPLTVRRYPDGITGQTFYQKNTPKYAPSWVRTITLPAERPGRDVAYTLCNDRRTLLWLANQASLELHPWLSRVDHLDRPDFMIFDIDPPEGRFDLALKVAMLTRDVLSDHEIRGVAKTSGAKGVHVYVPLVRRHDFLAVERAAYRLAAEATEREPDLVTTTWRKADRGGRVFLDATRMGMGKHIVAAYSPRARPGAPVSYPVPWERLERVDPSEFTIRTVPKLLDRDGDPWAALAPERQHLAQELVAPEP
jgi:bifunctional non-homologous end joining protein LigD